jgi:peptidoglycan biosynthesis protein MviN/MurJ (putative lipid II flippase)
MVAWRGHPEHMARFAVPAVTPVLLNLAIIAAA